MGELDVRRCHEPGEGHHLAAVTRLRGDEHPAREPKSLRLETERMRVTGGECVLDASECSPAASRRGVEECLHLVEDRGQIGVHGGGHPTAIIQFRPRRGMGRAAHLSAGHDPSFFAVLVALVLALALALAPAAIGSPLTKRLASALAVPHIDHSRSAAVALDLRTGKVVFSRNATLALLPASNEKLPVAYAALKELGPRFRFSTEALANGELDGTTWRGDVVLKGFGDPSLTIADLDGLALQVRDSGITHVAGAVLGDESYFDPLRTAPGWKASFYIEESPPLSALVAERGKYRGRTPRNPALAAASLFRQALERAGVTVAKRTRAGTAGAEALPMALHLSRPLRELVRFMGRESDNFTAEMLVKSLGAQATGVGSTAAGVAAIRASLATAGVPLAGVRLADGSGLSSLDRLTAASLVRLLAIAYSDPVVREPFIASLAVAGVNGTLEDRLESAPARSRVVAKTGTTAASSALSGFVRDRYAFAIVHNGRPVSLWWARSAQDRFATALASQ